MPRHHPTNVKKEMATQTAVPSTSTSDGLSRNELDEDGFVVLRGSAFGQRFDGFARKGLPFKSADGLDFCKLNVLSDAVSKLLYSCFGSSDMDHSVSVGFLSLYSHGVDLERTW